MANVRRVGDLEIEQDLGFERRMWTVQRVGWGLMALVVGAALLGLFGDVGPLSSTVAGEAGAPLQLHYERFARHAAPTALQVETGAGAGQGGTVRLWLDRAYLEGVQLQHITPQPQQVIAGADRLIYVFPVAAPGTPAAITFHLTTQQIGPLSGRVGLVDGPSLSFTQFVYP